MAACSLSRTCCVLGAVGSGICGLTGFPEALGELYVSQTQSRRGLCGHSARHSEPEGPALTQSHTCLLRVDVGCGCNSSCVLSRRLHVLPQELGLRGTWHAFPAIPSCALAGLPPALTVWEQSPTWQ